MLERYLLQFCRDSIDHNMNGGSGLRLANDFVKNGIEDGNLSSPKLIKIACSL